MAPYATAKFQGTIKQSANRMCKGTNIKLITEWFHS